jgi:tripartite-type tricarboxylate transporter receptor subunit TctC
MRSIRLCFCLLLPGIAAGPATAQSYPMRPIRIVLGFPPASTPDVVTRIVAERMAEDLAQSILVDNRPGAGGTIATQAVARASPDGYTLNVSGCSADGIVYAFVMTSRPPLDPFKDFSPVGRVMRDHWIVAVAPSLGVNSVAELIALGKAKPGTLTFPSLGIGTSQHLQAERFRSHAGFEATHVPYTSNPMPDLVAGRTSFIVQTSAAIASLVRSGKLQGLAVLSTERMSALPDVPTAAEAGIAGLLYNAGICLYAPGGTPESIIIRPIRR